MDQQVNRPPPIRGDELDVGLEFIRNSKTHRRLAPHKDEKPKVDPYLLRDMAKEIGAERMSKSKLAMLTGSIVARHIPYIDKESRALGNAYKSAIMAIYRERKKWQKFRREENARENAREAESPFDEKGQYRLV